MTNARPDISPEDALSAAQKLHAFRAGLPPGEQAVIDEAIKVFVDQVREDRSVDDLLAELPDSGELLADVAGFRLEADDQVAILPTTTTTFTPYTPPKVSALCPTRIQ